MIFRNFAICILFGVSLISTGQAGADVVNFVVDSTQSSVDVTVGGVGPETSQTSGSGVLQLSPSLPPFGVAQITAFDLVLDDGLSFSLFGGFVTATTADGDVTINMVTPGAAGTVSSGEFDQTDNLMGLDGDVVVVDPNGIVGGSQTFDLGDIAPSLVDFNDISLSRTGDIVTISGTYEIMQDIDTGSGTVPIVISGVYVASGEVVVVVPEPSGIFVLLTTFGIAVARRRRS